MRTQITTALTGQTDILAQIYRDAFREAYAAVAAWRAKNPGRSPWNDFFMYGTARMASLVTSRDHGMPGTEYLDEARVVSVSAQQAQVLAAQYAAKVEGKAAGMVDVTVSAIAADGSFTVSGRKGGHDVEIRQSVVTKTSPRGKWFHQFPAIVYVDGRRSTERALKAIAV